MEFERAVQETKSRAARARFHLLGAASLLSRTKQRLKSIER